MLNVFEDKARIKDLVSHYKDLLGFLNIDIFCVRRNANGEMYFIFNEGEISKKLNMPTELIAETSITMQVGHDYSSKLIQYYKRAFAGEIVKYKVRMKGIVFDTMLVPSETNMDCEYIIGISQEVTKLEKLSEHNTSILRELNIVKQRDDLVDVYSRVALKKIVNHQLNQLSKNSSSRLALILLDIDRLTQVNDVYGHTIGDQVLIETGKICSSRIRAPDYLGRWLGGQFLIISPNASFDGAMNLAERLRKNIELNEFTRKIRLTASFGIALVSSKIEFDQVVWNVEKAMHKAKRLGKNTVVIEDIS